jgi:transcriptional regulator with XRE-family HTH domain
MYRSTAPAYVLCGMKSDLQLRLGRRIGVFRRKRGYTQEQLAERCSFTMKFISTVERGKVNPPLSTLASIAKGLGVTISELTAGIDGLPSVAREGATIYAGRSRSEQVAIGKVLIALDEALRTAKSVGEED